MRLGDGVDATVTFPHLTGIISFKVINRNIRRSQKRKGDDALSSFSQTQFLIGHRISCVDTQLHPGLQVGIKISPKRITLKLRANNGSVLVHIGAGNKIANRLGTSTGRNLMLLHGGKLKNSLLPVGSNTQERRILKLSTLISCTEVHRHRIAVLSKLAQIHHFQAGGLTLHTVHPVVGKFGFTAAAFFGGNQYHAIGALRTINCGCRGILKNFHRLDVGRVQRRNGRDRRNGTITQSITQTQRSTAGAAALQNNAIDHIKRLGIGIDGTLSTYPNGYRTTGGTGSSHRSYTGCTPLQGLVDVGNYRTFNFVLTYRNRSTRKVAPLHGSITNNHHLIQAQVGSLHHYIDYRTTAHLNNLVFKTNKTEHQGFGLLWDTNVVIAVDIGNHTNGGAFYHNGNSGKG